MYFNYFADSGTFWNIIRLLQNLLVHIYKFPVASATMSGWPVWPCHLTWHDRVPLLWVSPCERHDVTHWAWCSNETVKYIQAVTSFNWEMYLEWWERNFQGLTQPQWTLWEIVPDNPVYVPWTNPSPGLQDRFSDFVKNCDFFAQISIPAQYK